MTYVTTDVKKRAEKWNRIFGTNKIPVLHSEPRQQCLAGTMRERIELCYDLDIKRLPRATICRLAATMFREVPYHLALREMQACVTIPIVARGCRVVE